MFTEINWDNKVFELNGKGIDVVWNGMTLTDRRPWRPWSAPTPTATTLRSLSTK